jgi:hypothetical protein
MTYYVVPQVSTIIPKEHAFSIFGQYIPRKRWYPPTRAQRSIVIQKTIMRN